jgi:hypothetical protein
MSYAEIDTTDLASPANAAELEQAFVGLLDELADYDEGGISRVNSFADAGVLTSDAGLVLRYSDGTEFQIHIVQSR